MSCSLREEPIQTQLRSLSRSRQTPMVGIVSKRRLPKIIILSPVMFSPHGLNNVDRPSCHIRVIADRPPVARVTSPTEEQAVGAQDVVEVKFEAHDDHGIAKAELVVYGEPVSEGEEPLVLSVQDIPLGDQQLSRHLQAAAQLDLSKLDLIEGEKISFAVRVSDNRAGHIDVQAAAKRERNASVSASAEPQREGSAPQSGAAAVDDGTKVAMNSSESAPGQRKTRARWQNERRRRGRDGQQSPASQYSDSDRNSRRRPEGPRRRRCFDGEKTDRPRACSSA